MRMGCYILMIKRRVSTTAKDARMSVRGLFCVCAVLCASLLGACSSGTDSNADEMRVVSLNTAPSFSSSSINQILSSSSFDLESAASSSSSPALTFWVAPVVPAREAASGVPGSCVLPASLSPNGYFVDSRDCAVYAQVTVGTQTWMAENLNFNSGAGAVCYNDSLANCNTYGRLYSWMEMTGLPQACTANPCTASLIEPFQGVCPSGWHLPSATEMNTLWAFVAQAGYAGKQDVALKALDFGMSGNYGLDVFGFRVIPAGMQMPAGTFRDLNVQGYIWTLGRYEPTPANPEPGYGVVWDLNPGSHVPSTHPEQIEYKSSVRCIMNG
jgi:uncharacterized protein (TIGR02145 family)